MGEVHDIKAEVRRYFLVFGALMVLTVITVAISYLDVSTPVAITLALIVATTKGSLVCLFFMHLISEKNFIYTLLFYVVIFFIGMMWLTVGGYYSVPQGTEFIIPEASHVEAMHHGDHHAESHGGGHH